MPIVEFGSAQWKLAMIRELIVWKFAIAWCDRVVRAVRRGLHEDGTRRRALIRFFAFYALLLGGKILLTRALEVAGADFSLSDRFADRVISHGKILLVLDGIFFGPWLESTMVALLFWIIARVTGSGTAATIGCALILVGVFHGIDQGWAKGLIATYGFAIYAFAYMQQRRRGPSSRPISYIATLHMLNNAVPVTLALLFHDWTK